MIFAFDNVNKIKYTNEAFLMSESFRAAGAAAVPCTINPLQMG